MLREPILRRKYSGRTGGKRSFGNSRRITPKNKSAEKNQQRRKPRRKARGLGTAGKKIWKILKKRKVVALRVRFQEREKGGERIRENQIGPQGRKKHRQLAGFPEGNSGGRREKRGLGGADTFGIRGGGRGIGKKGPARSSSIFKRKEGFAERREEKRVSQTQGGNVVPQRRFWRRCVEKQKTVTTEGQMKEKLRGKACWGQT